MEDEKFKDLLEDEELTALRLAALATKKKNELNSTNTSESSSALPINSIITTPSTASNSVSNQIPFVQSDRSAFNNNYSWRKQNHPLRRRGAPFIKSNQRSNLIVISPIALNEGKDSEEKTPALILPQHKWCNSGNEDSMSPKTLRRTGPTRFNRHGSDSESSDDSDYEPSDNDSGSNETVLQDEHSENFPHLSPGCDTVSDNVEKKRRLSFQTLESEIKSDTFDKNEPTSVYNLLRNSTSYADNKSDNYAKQNRNDGRQSWNHSVENEFDNYKQYNSGHAYATKPSDLSEKFVGKQANSCVTSNGESNADETKVFINQSSDTSNIWPHVENKTGISYYSKDSENSRNQHGQGPRSNNSFYPRETAYNACDSRNFEDNTKAKYPSEDDLRLELKKRMQEIKSQSATSEKNETDESKSYGQINTWDKKSNVERYGYEKDKITDVSCTDSFVNKQESSTLQRNTYERSFSRERYGVKHTSNPNQRRYHRSLSREKNTPENFSNRDRDRFEYKSGSERKRYGRSSSLSRNRNDRSSSRGRSRYERSSSREKRRRERSSSQDKLKHENTNKDTNRRDCSISPSRKKREHSFSQERDSHERSFRQSKKECDLGKDRKRDEYISSQNRKRSDRSSSQDKSKQDRSSSSDSRDGRSLSRDRNRHAYYSSRSRNKQERRINKDRHERSLSGDRSKHENSPKEGKHVHNSSRKRSRHESSGSSDSRSERSQERSRRSSSHDNSSDEQSLSHGESRHKHSSRGTFNASKHNSNQHKSRQESTSVQEEIQECSLQTKKLDYSGNSERVKEEEVEKISSKKQYKSVERSRLKHSSSKEKDERQKRPPQKYSRVNDSYKDKYSRSQSSSSESYSSSYSSSSSHSSKPTIRSVPSVIKTVLTKTISTESRESFTGNKSVGKNMNSAVSLSDGYSASTKNKDFSNYNKLSNIKCDHVEGNLKASDSNKRVPVHMRLGAFPRKRVIQMPKDVEAAFVNSSSSSDDENVNTKCKRQNIRIVADVYDAKSGLDSLQQRLSSKEKPAKRSPDNFQEKSKRVKTHR